MPDYTAQELAGWSGGAWTAVPSVPIAGVTQDTRELKPGFLFVALRGENGDGHAFVAEALAQGACGAVVAADWPAPAGHGALLRVADPRRALGAMAAGYRRRRGGLVVGVTGSAGKTTVKDLIAAMLAQRLPTARTRGNWNNDIGLPLSLLAMEPEHRAGVFELGMNHPGELAALCDILQPDWGVVTSVGPVHLEFFPSVEAIADEKAVLLARLPPQGLAFLNRDGAHFERLRARAAGRVVTVSLAAEADFRGRPAGGAEPEARVREARSGEEFDLHAPLPGRHQLENALLAVAVARAAGVPWDGIRAALEHFVAAPMRWEQREAHGVRLINDAYNANPMSMQAALGTFEALAAEGRKWVVVGGMLELGAAADEAHRALGARLARTAWAGVVTVGALGDRIAEGVRAAGTAVPVEPCSTPAEAGRWLAGQARAGDAVLFKASRGVRLEEAVREFLRMAGGPAA